MTKDTPRDRVWSFAIMKVVNGEEFKKKHVKNNISNPPSDRTIRDTLNTMVQFGWLEKEKEQSETWQGGPVASKISKWREYYEQKELPDGYDESVLLD